MTIRKSKTALALVALSLFIFIYFVSVIAKGKDLFFDGSIQKTIMDLFPEGTHSFFEFISAFGDKIGIGAIAIIVLVWLWIRKKDYLGMAAFVLSVGLGNEFNKIVKDAIARPRPHFHDIADADSMSFPSGHAMVGFVLYMFIAYLIARKLKGSTQKWLVTAAAFLFILLIGVSRVVLGAHFPSDVIGGYALGLIWLYLWIALYEVLQVKLTKRVKIRT
ncbi:MULTISPECIES: phosphatase PAP2 family protein [unclassified Niallia]|uniref:phosphatase PAP2 family protein n=2 Tax=Bacteria TaxID=2 RepID=UPI001EDB8F6B|nr:MULTISPECIES: phosphatase PAP2 family protein [unclassified Niallia]MCM3030340.1 phosphatase PAP2 family protein [Niallia sp. MER 6]MDL0436779.1 phosphatase PAP2 family protein [Niallia sp. SS-2023]UPO88305.1 phosphatase PAP2 family protein [Niallia sp. Man26]